MISKQVNHNLAVIHLTLENFKIFSKGFIEPFDDTFMQSIFNIMKWLCENINGCLRGYAFSEEIILIVNSDDDKEHLLSTAASKATMAFNYFFQKEIMDYFNPNDYYRLPYWNKEEMNNEYGYFKQAYFQARSFSSDVNQVSIFLQSRQLSVLHRIASANTTDLVSIKSLEALSETELKNYLASLSGFSWDEYPPYCFYGMNCSNLDDSWKLDSNAGMITNFTIHN